MILRQQNWLPQQRVDLPHLRALESSLAADIDTLAGRMLAGKQPLVLKGFNVLTTGAIGAQASNLQVNVADGLVQHFSASESGTIFWVPRDRALETLNSINTKLAGSFAASQTNYVGLDLRRTADDTTSDNLQFLTGNGSSETSKTVPLARTLDYRFVVSTVDFSSQATVLPLAIVTTDANNNVLTIADARRMMFRLGQGGDFPNRYSAYSWPGTRFENQHDQSGEFDYNVDVFSGGDKSIGSYKEWMDAVMTRLKEIGGGEYWYSATADRNVNMIWTGSPFTGGENFEWDGTNLHWKGLRFLFDNSNGTFNDVADQISNSTGLTNLNDGDCVYVDLDRTQNLTGGSSLVALKAPLSTLGSPTSGTARYIFAWRNGANIYTRQWRYAVGTSSIPATTTTLGVVKLNNTPGSAPAPVVPSIMSNGQIEVAATGGNSYGGKFTGNGTGVGVKAVAGGSSTYSVDFTSAGGQNLLDPVNQQDAATKNYADQVGSRVSLGPSVLRASLSGSLSGFGGLALGGQCIAIAPPGTATTTARFVLVGSNAGPVSAALSSLDGITWSATTISASFNAVFGANLPLDIIFANNTFVAVGQGGKIGTSTDGLNWTARTSGTAARLVKVTYSASLGMWAVSGNGVLLTSTSLSTWSSITLASPFTLGDNFVVWGDGPAVFVVTTKDSATTTAALLTSANGTVWTSHTAPAANLLNLAYGPFSGTPRFVLLEDSASKFWYSSDGITWTATAANSGPFANAPIYSIWNGNHLVFTGAGASPYMYRSHDGITWTLLTTPLDNNTDTINGMAVGYNSIWWTSSAEKVYQGPTGAR